MVGRCVGDMWPIEQEADVVDELLFVEEPRTDRRTLGGLVEHEFLPFRRHPCQLPPFRARCARQHFGKTVCAVAVLAALSSAFVATRRPRMTRHSVRGLVTEQLTRTDAEASCSSAKEGVDLVFEDQWLVLVDRVPMASRCCALCRSQAKCHGWTWMSDDVEVESSEHHQCWLKGGNLSMEVMRKGVISGVAHVVDRVAAQDVTSLEPVIAQTCSAHDADVDYVFQGDWLGLVENVLEPLHCCDLCRARDSCAGWTWSGTAGVKPDDQNKCWLKGGILVQKVPKLGVTSGLGKAALEKTTSSSTTTQDMLPTLAPVQTVPPITIVTVPPVVVATAQAQVSMATTSVPTTQSATTVTTATPSTTTEAPTTTMEASTATTEAPTTTTEVTTITTEALTTTEEPTTTSKEPAKTVAVESTTATVEKPATTVREEPRCAGPDENGNCLKSNCCKEAGFQCFAKDDYWAECMRDCTPGPNLLDGSSNDPWTCKAVGERAPGEPKRCSAAGENCLNTKCCAELGMQCFAKNKTFGKCKTACEPGIDLTADDWQPWSCDAVGPRSKSPASWIPKKCARGSENCAEAHCCAESGMQCYLQNDYYGQCKRSCEPTEWNKCTVAGPRTPTLQLSLSGSMKVLGSWVESRCSDLWENCMDSKCCHEVGAQCYAKNEGYATCKTSCNASAVDPKDNSTWSCKALGPRSWGLATRGYPSLYCFSLYMPERYERGLMQSMLEMDAGIFACDGYDVFAAKNDTLRSTDGRRTVEAVLIPKITVGVSQDGTAANAKLFMAVWDKVIAAGRFRYYDWTLKVDPDAVLLPWRLREHVLPHVGKKVYVVNCNKFPGSPNFPMMYGAIEAFSQSAMLAYADKSWKCGTQLPWKKWGEDYYMTHCMDFIGVGRIGDFSILGDNMCVGANCADMGVASFHPFKTPEAWKKCWTTATVGR